MMRSSFFLFLNPSFSQRVFDSMEVNCSGSLGSKSSSLIASFSCFLVVDSSLKLSCSILFVFAPPVGDRRLHRVLFGELGDDAVHVFDEVQLLLRRLGDASEGHRSPSCVSASLASVFADFLCAAADLQKLVGEVGRFLLERQSLAGLGLHR